MKSYIGADLGGTKLLLGELDGEGRILRTERFPSGPLSQREALDLLQNALDKFLATRTPGYEPAALGLGLIGRIDGKTGVWHEIDRNRGEALPLGQLLGERCGLPCFLDNDVRSATKAELRFGEGRLTRDFVYLNIGTGIAAGFVSGGRMITGGHCNAGEVGHTSSGLSLGVPCPCGRSDCAEAIASGLLAALNTYADLEGLEHVGLPKTGALGSLVAYATDPATSPYQPMHVNFGLVPSLGGTRRKKKERYQAYADRATKDLADYLAQRGDLFNTIASPDSGANDGA